VVTQFSYKDKNNAHSDMHRFFCNFDDRFSNRINKTIKYFWLENFDIKLISIEKTPGVFWKGNNYFVSQANVSEDTDCFIRLSETACNFFFEHTLGSNNNSRFKLDLITELESELLSKFNNIVFEKIKSNFLSKPEIKKLSQSDNIFDEKVHLGFILYKEGFEDIESGKIIISIPENIINIEETELDSDGIDISRFNKAKTNVDIFVGYSRVSLEELKNLDCEDIIVLDKSNIHQMKVVGDYEFDFEVTPDPRLVYRSNLDNEGGDEEVDQELTADADNMWDNIQIDVGAEFKKVKLSLGELRQMSEGLIVDIASVYNNDITLTVENKPVAKGELIIIGDKYGVKITHIVQNHKPAQSVQQEEPVDEEEFEEDESEQDEKEEMDDDDFDLSDFEIEEDDV
jgi:flagellar motor switch protein FliN/FliY